MHTSSMALPWAEGSKHWPSDVVERIYPRFLYIFSDVVCYVSVNLKYVPLSSCSIEKALPLLRTTGNDMEQLIGWAYDAQQPIKRSSLLYSILPTKTISWILRLGPISIKLLRSYLLNSGGQSASQQSNVCGENVDGILRRLIGFYYATTAA